MKLLKKGDKVIHEKYGKGEILFYDVTDNSYLVGFYDPGENLHNGESALSYIPAKFVNKCWWVYFQDNRLKTDRNNNTHVYVVLEHHIGNKDSRVHGVYNDRDAALKAKYRLNQKTMGYISVLKQRVKGEPIDE